MIALITPVIALALGNILNHEPLTLEVIMGASLILSGLMIFEFDKRYKTIRSLVQRL